MPRVAAELALAPVRAALWVYERYDLEVLWKQVLFDDAMTFGVVPVANIDSHHGVLFGARLVHYDLFGARERLSLRAAAGGRFRQRIDGTLSTGHRLGARIVATLGGEYDREPNDAFYGVGNASTGKLARYRRRLERASATLDVRVFPALHLRGAGALTDLEFGGSDQNPSIERVYATAALGGWDGVRHAYGEAELQWDSRRPASQWDPPSVRSTGGLVSVFAGRIHPLRSGDNYSRYGIDLQRFLYLAPGPRLIWIGAHAEAVTGDYADVAFAELPALGGRYLRSYPIERFRDRVAGSVSLEYQWDLGRNLLAGLFVEAGRVYRSLDELTVDGMRTGYGFSLQAQTDHAVLGRGSIATSRDGGITVMVAFDPVSNLEPRVVRR